MDRKRVGLLLVVVMFAILLSVGVAQSAGKGSAGRSKCQIQGAWVSSFMGPWETPLIMQETITPLDPAGKKLSYVMHLVNPDATFGFPFPPFSEAETMSDVIGEAVRSGRNEYEFSLIGYAVKEVPADRGEIVYIWTVSGTMSCVDGKNKTDDVNIAIYLASQDADKDGYPDDEEEPFFCTPGGPLAVGKRVPQMPACVPTEMEG